MYKAKSRCDSYQKSRSNGFGNADSSKQEAFTATEKRKKETEMDHIKSPLPPRSFHLQKDNNSHSVASGSSTSPWQK